MTGLLRKPRSILKKMGEALQYAHASEMSSFTEKSHYLSTAKKLKRAQRQGRSPASSAARSTSSSARPVSK